MRAPAPRIELVVLQPTPFCNIDCRYCYLPTRDDRAVVAIETLEALFRQMFESGWAEDVLDVVWHAGEPMVLPVAFYERAFRAIAAVTPPGQVVTHAFQTNATLVDEAWCAFLRTWGVRLGVSIDGPRHLHDRNRVDRAGRGTFDRAIRGLRTLRAHGVPFHVLAVLSPEAMRAPREMFAFCVEEGIEEIGFNVEESEGTHVSGTLAEGGVAALYADFMRAFWRLSAASPERHVSIREVEAAIRAVVRPAGGPLGNPLAEAFAVLSMDAAGNVATFSPELLGQRHAGYEDFVLGNVATDRLADMLDRPNLARMRADIEAGVATCRETCGYFAACGGGEPVNKLAERGTFAATETMHCRLTRMAMTDLVLDALDAADLSSLRAHATHAWAARTVSTTERTLPC